MGEEMAGKAQMHHGSMSEIWELLTEEQKREVALMKMEMKIQWMEMKINKMEKRIELKKKSIDNIKKVQGMIKKIRSKGPRALYPEKYG